MKNSKPTVSNLMLTGKEKQTRMLESTKSYLSTSTFPPIPFAPTRAVTRLPSTEQNTQASESLVMNVDFTDS